MLNVVTFPLCTHDILNSAFVIYATSLPSVREKTGSAELRISSETQFPMIWNEQKFRGYYKE